MGNYYVAFSTEFPTELLEWARKLSGFGGKKSLAGLFSL